MSATETTAPGDQDILTRLLHPIFLGSHFYHAAKHCGEWLLNHQHAVAPSFHLVTEGQCRLTWQDGQEEMLAERELVFFPGDTPHRLMPGSREAICHPSMVSLRSPQPGTGLVCGQFRFLHDVPPTWFHQLPRIVRLPVAQRHTALDQVVNAIIDEMTRHDSPGHELTVNALANALLTMLLRHCLEHALLDQRSLGAFLDPPINRAISLLHEDPTRHWTVAQLATQAGLSRSSLSERFPRVVGITVANYQARLRMILADQALARGESVMGAMLASGYRSESTFRKAYQRIRGMPPRRLHHPSA
ncbi:AraC family transcriptional regulator [Halomonas sp. 18H]|nr:AraC family transcriptional regulator [Halomonas sp. 18H]MCW4152134.1 AraC family transcriptional regulator [Halomonas sp. 18H]